MFDINSTFYLTPQHGGVETCIQVHNMKTEKLRRYLGLANGRRFYEKLHIGAISKIVSTGATRYGLLLSSKSLDEDVNKFMSHVLH